jgi:hypothetical protein
MLALTNSSSKTPNKKNTNTNTQRKQNAKKSQTKNRKDTTQNPIPNCSTNNPNPNHRLSIDRLKTKQSNGARHNPAGDSDRHSSGREGAAKGEITD